LRIVYFCYKCVEVGNDDGLPLWTWSYPHIQSTVRQVCLRKCDSLLRDRRGGSSSSSSVAHSSVGGGGDEGNNGSVFKYFHLEAHWYYILLSGSMPEVNGSGSAEGGDGVGTRLRFPEVIINKRVIV
jgi:hypothetical protein